MHDHEMKMKETKHLLMTEIDKMIEGGVDSWDELEKLHLLMATKHHLCEYMKGYRHDGSYHHEEDDEKYERVFEMIEKVLDGEKMPATWMPYMGKPGGHMSIIEMELGEMDKAYKGMKATTPTVTHSDFIHEMVHAAAAIVYAIEAMTCDK